MPIIVFGNSKGGAGKTTSAVLLASELAERGAGVTLIDGDPNRPITQWANTPEKPAKLAVMSLAACYPHLVRSLWGALILGHGRRRRAGGRRAGRASKERSYE